MQHFVFYSTGLHCKSCVLFTEDELKKDERVSSVTVNLHQGFVKVSGNFGSISPQEIAKELTLLVAPRGYALSLEKTLVPIAWDEFRRATPWVVLFTVVFVLLQKAGLINLVNASHVSFGTAFVIGIVASLSTCMAVVGGLALSVSASFAKAGEATRPQLLFHIGRIVSFFVLGGIMGAAGGFLQLSHTGVFVVSVVMSLVMLVLGVNLLDVFQNTKRFQVSLPKVFSQKIAALATLNHIFTPLLLGVATFFLPCGFTQSMQLFALSTGSFWQGGLTMLFFALGTFPVLALMSFGSLSLQKSSQQGVFFKTAGLIVILFALLTLWNSFIAMGFIS